ncbi:NAD+ synthase [Streptomyces sp. NPDC050658]|uniref:NAD+ synthase n=1 Tax=unclassified Streptomyces TaxID=2593676 RepID=UPI0034487046
MAGFRLALVQMNAVLGDLNGNIDAMRQWTAKAAAAHAQLVVFPQSAITGFPLEDLAARPSFADDAYTAAGRFATALAADGLGGLPVVSGCLAPDGWRHSVVLIHEGQIMAAPSGDRDDSVHEPQTARHFAPQEALTVVRVAGFDLALALGEDVLAPDTPAIAAARAGAVDLVVTTAAFPYRMGGFDGRLNLLRQRSAEADVPLACVNLVGGQDDHVFDGGSVLLASDGQLVARTERFEEQLLVAEVKLPTKAGTPSPLPAGVTLRHLPLDAPLVSSSPMPGMPVRLPPLVATPRGKGTGVEQEVWQALVTGIRDYTVKNGFESVIVGLSGGVDSAVTAVLACDALGPDKVVAVSMPSACSTDHSRGDAAELARRVGLDFRSIAIQPHVDAVLDTIELDGVAVENVQARMRSLLLMALSNQEGHLMLNTGNKTEYGCGHATLYGDSAGGYAPLKDVPKTLVWRLAHWRNVQAEQRGEAAPVPENIILKEPSPELRPGQVDSQLLPASYEVLDLIIAGYVDQGLCRDALVAEGLESDVVDRVIEMIEHAEFKRHQAPPGPRISAGSFGRDRRLPVTNRYRDRGAEGREVPGRV